MFIFVKTRPVPPVARVFWYYKMTSSWTGGWRRVRGDWSSCSNPVRLARIHQKSTGNSSRSLQNNSINLTERSISIMFNTKKGKYRGMDEFLHKLLRAEGDKLLNQFIKNIMQSKKGPYAKDCYVVMYMYRKGNHSNQVSDFIFNKYS